MKAQIEMGLNVSFRHEAEYIYINCEVGGLFEDILKLYPGWTELDLTSITFNGAESATVSSAYDPVRLLNLTVDEMWDMFSLIKFVYSGKLDHLDKVITGISNSLTLFMDSMGATENQKLLTLGVINMFTILT